MLTADPTSGEAPAQGGARGTTGSPAYAFLHDRVQQAAYAQIPDDRRQLVHLTVGRLLLERQQRGGGEERLFDIVRGDQLAISPTSPERGLSHHIGDFSVLATTFARSPARRAPCSISLSIPL